LGSPLLGQIVDHQMKVAFGLHIDVYVFEIALMHPTLITNGSLEVGDCQVVKELRFTWEITLLHSKPHFALNFSLLSLQLGSTSVIMIHKFQRKETTTQISEPRMRIFSPTHFFSPEKTYKPSYRAKNSLQTKIFFLLGALTNGDAPPFHSGYLHNQQLVDDTRIFSQ
jgi:hypothetical protein